MASSNALPSQCSYTNRILQFGLVLVMILVANGGAWAQVAGTPGQAAAHAVVNVAELARQEAANPPAPSPPRVIPFLGGPRRSVPPERIRPGKPTPPTAALDLPSAPINSPSPAESFEALGDNNLAIPPDTMGAAGPNHLMVTLNTEVRIQNRSGGTINTVSLNSFWSGVPCTSLPNSGVFDPKLTYDPTNNRWIFAAVCNANTVNSSVLIGVSQSSDPTGTWNLYRVDADSGDTLWADYPSLGFNKDWVVVSVNMFANAGNAFVGTNLFVFRKSNLYAGTGALFTLFETFGFTQAPAVTYDTSLATIYLVEDLNGNIGGGAGELGISTITGTVGEEVYTDLASVAIIDSTWASEPPGMADFAPQKEGETVSLHKIQNGDSRILNAVYRNGSLWAAQNAFLPASAPTRTAAQWWQFLPDIPDATVLQFGRVDGGTGPTPVFYAYPSIAVNSQSDVLLGFSTFSGTQFAGAGYTFHAVADVAGTMQAPAVLKAGVATYYKTLGGPDNRWGDYSSTVVDPVNDLDFWTIQEYASSPSGDDRWGTWWGKIGSPEPPPATKRRRQLVSD